MGQGDSKGLSPSSFVRRESTKSFSNGSTGLGGSGGSARASRKSVQLTEKERKKLQQLQQKAEYKRSRQLDKDEVPEKKTGRERAATKIQAAMRGTIGRRKFAKYKDDREKKAAMKIQAAVRGWLVRRNYKNIKGRTVVAKELHTTERHYLAYLSAIIKYYIKPLRLMDENDHPLLTDDEMKVIFNQVEVIHAYNMQFLVALEYNIGKKWSYMQTVGDIFLTFVEFFRAPYKQFIMKYSEASAMLDICIKRSGVDAFFQRCKKQEECGNRDLRSLLSMPFQRIPRYILLLKELLKYTRRDHDDFTYIYQALQKMEDLATSANEQIRHFELTNAVLDISKSFEPPIQNLVNPYRKFRKDGELKCKKEHSNEKFFDATVFLFNDCVIAAVKLSSKATTKFRPKLVVNLKNCVVLDCAGNDGADEGERRLTDSWDVAGDGDIRLTDPSDQPPRKQSYEFRIHSLTESVIFRAISQESKDLWMSNIITEVNLLTESKLTSHPLWRSKASYGIGSLRKRTLQKNRSLTQAKFEPNLPVRKDSAAKEPQTSPRSGSGSTSPPMREGVPRKESGANVEAQNHAKHIAELSNLVASKQRSKSVVPPPSPSFSSTSPSASPPPSANASPELTKPPPKAPSKTPRDSMIALPGLGQLHKLKPSAGREKSVTSPPSRNPLSMEQTIHEPPPSDSPKLPSSILSADPQEELVAPSISEPLFETIPEEEPSELTTSTAESFSNTNKRTTELIAPDPFSSTPSNISLSDVIYVSETSTIASTTDSALQDLALNDTSNAGRMSLAASLGLELAPGVDEGLIELGTAFIEAAREHSNDHMGETAERTETETTPHASAAASGSESPSHSTDSPKPSIPKPLPLNSSSRPILPSLLSSASVLLSPTLLSPLSPPLHSDHENTHHAHRKHARAPPLYLDHSQPLRKESPPSSTVSSPSLASPRWSSLFDSPRGSRADLSSPTLGHKAKRLTHSQLHARQSSEENLLMSPTSSSSSSPQKSPGPGVIPSSPFLSHFRAGRMARVSKYDSSSSGGLRRSSSMSDNSDSEGGDSFLGLSSTFSNAPQGPPLSLPSLPMPRSVSSDAIMCLPAAPRAPPSSPASPAPLLLSFYDDPDAYNNGEVSGYFNARMGGEMWDSELVDDKVVEIFYSRFRSLSFSCVEDLLEYGYVVDAQI